MAIPKRLAENLTIPCIAAPMFLVSGPDLVVETCRAGLLGTFPALNQRTSDGFAAWLDEIEARLADAGPHAAYGVNLIVHGSNPRLTADLEIAVRHRVPIIITSLGAVSEIVQAVHGYGGLVFHDVTTRRHAEKAAQAGVDGIVAVAAGAGGHAGTMSPFALLSEIRSVFDGMLVLSGAMNSGRDIAAARMMGADLAYLGTRFLATRESLASQAQKEMTRSARAGDIVYTASISGVPANFLRRSLEAAGLDPADLPGRSIMDLEGEARAWKTIWSAGHGVGGIDDIPATADLCGRLVDEYRSAVATLSADPYAAP